MLDLHIHTTASDGSLTPTQVVQLARKKGFSLIAVTDHDTMGCLLYTSDAADERHHGRCCRSAGSWKEI